MTLSIENMELSIEEQRAYVNAIDILFDGAVRAEPYQITPEVVLCVESMFNDITTCHLRIKSFLGVLNTIGGRMAGLVPKLFAQMLDFERKGLAEYIKDVGVKVLKQKAFELLVKNVSDKKKGVAEYVKFISDLIDAWFAETENNKRYRMCINTARANWRTRMELALLDIF